MTSLNERGAHGAWLSIPKRHKLLRLRNLHAVVGPIDVGNPGVDGFGRAVGTDGKIFEMGNMAVSKGQVAANAVPGGKLLELEDTFHADNLVLKYCSANSNVAKDGSLLMLNA